MSRLTAALGILLLAACRDDHPKKTHLVVENKSVETVLVYVKYEVESLYSDFRLDFVLEATSGVEYKFVEASRLEVSVFRASDNQVLFLDSWTRKELDDLGDRVTVTLEP